MAKGYRAKQHSQCDTVQRQGNSGRMGYCGCVRALSRTHTHAHARRLSLLAALNPVHWSTTELVAALVASVAALGLVIVS